MEPMKYMVLSDNSLSFLEKRVNNLIENGWKPQGNIFIQSNGFLRSEYYQAMLKE